MTTSSRRQGTSAASSPGQGTASPSPPASTAGPRWEDDDDPRRVAHELVGQAHAVLVIAIREDVLPHWCQPEFLDVVRDTGPPLWLAVGEMQAAIASGAHDEGLAKAGLAGILARPKRKGLRGALERLCRAIARKRAASVRRWLKSGAGMARTAVGSMAKEVPGGEIVAEALDGILSGLDTVEALAGESHED